VAERSNGAVSKSVVPLTGDRGLKSLSLRRSVRLFWGVCHWERKRLQFRWGTKLLAMAGTGGERALEIYPGLVDARIGVAAVLVTNVADG
jgi:hypothetical protein